VEFAIDYHQCPLHWSRNIAVARKRNREQRHHRLDSAREFARSEARDH